MPTQHAAVAQLSSPLSPAILLQTPWSDRSDVTQQGTPALHFTQDREIYGEGDDAEFFFKVASGVVRTCKFLSDGRRQIDAFHFAGDVFGVEAGADYSFSAEAVSDCTLIPYRRRGLERSAFSDAALSQQLFAYAMHSMAEAQAHAQLLGRRSAMEKVALFLLDCAKRSSTGREIVLAMTRQDIADYLGLTIETVSRTLSALEREALIEFASSRKIRLRDLDALRDLKG